MVNDEVIGVPNWDPPKVAPAEGLADPVRPTLPAVMGCQRRLLAPS
jgi:hypothetical protein